MDGVLDSADGRNADLICERLRPGDRYVALRGLPSADFAERWAAKGIVCRVASGPDSAGAWPDMAKVVAQGPVRPVVTATDPLEQDRTSQRLNSSHYWASRMPAFARKKKNN